ncbi:hypothetical protein LPJ74_004828 [Coemansia sp. RSA 1843]|nr:hypothetical protein LPJ74_004828 [Coemansia sp. RSA 1843]
MLESTSKETAIPDTDALSIRADSSTDPPVFNPIGITFNYTLGWVDVTTSTFGVSLLPVKQSTYVEGTPWSLLIRYDPSARANITQLSPGWGLGIYDYASWVLLPSSAPYNDIYFTVHSTGQMNLEDTVEKLAVPAALMLIGDASPKPSSEGYKLYQDHDYFIENVNMAQLPKAAFGAWTSLADTNAEAMNIAQASTSTDFVDMHSDSILPSGVEFDMVKDGGDSTTSLPTTDTESEAVVPTFTLDNASDEDAKVAPQDMETLLPPVKYIAGDPDYDPDIDPIGTIYGAPLIGPILVNIILGIGLAVHIAATIRRYQYRRMYKMSLLQAKSGTTPYA